MSKKYLSLKMDINIELCENPKDVDEDTVLKGILKDIEEYVTRDDDDDNTVKLVGKIKSMKITDKKNNKL